MKLKQTLIAAAIAVAPMTAIAGGSLDAFYIDNEMDIDFGGGSQTADGDGFGLRGEAALGHGLSLTGLYQNSDIKADGDELDILETRVGVSYKHQLNKQFNVGGGIEVVQFDLKDGFEGLAFDGYSVNLTAGANIIGNLSAHGRVAYTDFGSDSGIEIDGVEYELGLAYALTKNAAVFVDYRIFEIDLDGSGVSQELDLDTIRAGGRFTF